jgi:sugar phosphate isomerase/epimerase
VNQISFHTANYVARQLGYNMTRGWGQGDMATQEYFKPIETFGARFEEILKDIHDMGFSAVDLWTAHINPNWATQEHFAIARDLLDKYHLKILSTGGWFGSTPEEFETTCKLAVALGIKVLGGSTTLLAKDRSAVVRLLKQYNLLLAWENHPEKTPQEVLATIGDSAGGLIGTCVDTGWFGTQGYDAAKALEELGQRVMAVHLKDVLAPGAHDTCRYGKGVVPIEQCVRVLQRAGYQGGISIEHEPEHYDPTEDIRAGLAMLRGWLGQS